MLVVLAMTVTVNIGLGRVRVVRNTGSGQSAEAQKDQTPWMKLTKDTEGRLGMFIRYKLECGHILLFKRHVKTKDGKRWCRKCRKLRAVINMRIESAVQKKLEVWNVKVE
jgi:hypothetical protein